MNSIRRVFINLLGLLLIVSCAFAALMAPRSLVGLEQNADLIVVGRANWTVQSRQVINFTIEVSRVVKGDPTLAEQTVFVNWPSNFINLGASGTATGSGTGIWFLQGAGSQWTVYPVMDGAPVPEHAFFPALSGPILSAYAYEPTASLNDKLASEVCSAIEGANGPLPVQLSGLQYGFLDQLKSPVIQVLYQRQSAASATRQTILGLSGQIRNGSGAALITAIQSANTFAAHPLENGILTLAIRDDFRAVDANSIAALGAAATKSNLNSSFREATAHALASIHTAATLPFLAALLDDPSAALRAEGIGGLGAFANGLAMQTRAGVQSLQNLQLNGPNSPYRTKDTIQNFAQGSVAISQNEARYLSFWQSWWSQNRASLGY